MEGSAWSDPPPTILTKPPLPTPGLSQRRASAPRLLIVGLWFGLLTGFAEVLAMALKLYVVGEFLTLSPHAVWMAPVVDAILFVGITATLLLVRSLLPRFGAAEIAGVLVFAGMVAVLLPFRGLHIAASLLIAAGVGVQAARLVRGRETGLTRIAARGASGLLVVTLVLAVTMLVRERSETSGETSGLPAPAGAPSILLVILDTVRARSMSLYGSPRPTTPKLAEFAARGLVFERAIAPAPWTLPSHASMFTGRYPTELATNWNTPLEKGPATLAEVLSERGYATAGFVANYRYTGWETGLGRGFRHYDDYRITVGEMLRSAALTSGVHKTLGSRLGLPPLRPRVDATDINRRFLDWLDRRSAPGPFFVFLNYLDAHDPYDASPGFQEAFAPGPREARPRDGVHVTEPQAGPELRLYEAAIAYLDSAVGGMLDELERRGELANTLVVITSDHGEEFAEHGIMGHAASLYRPSVEVPLVLWYPARLAAGRLPGPVSLRNLPATILDLSGSVEPRIPGRSWRRLWDGTASEGDTVISHIRRLINQPEWWPASQGDMISMVGGGYRYILTEGSAREELFDFEADVEERRELSGTPADSMLPAFRAAVQAFTRSAPRH